MSKVNEFIFKIVILGRSDVGKTSLCMRYMDGNFLKNQITTIGIDNKSKFYKFNEDKVRVNFVDTAGQEKFHSITKSFLQNSNGVLLVYDITSQISFNKLQDWIVDINKFCNEIPIVVLGNKCDLKEKREVPTNKGREFAEQRGYAFFEGSALANENVDEAFEEVARRTYLFWKEEYLNREHRISLENKNNGKKKHRCCKSLV